MSFDLAVWIPNRALSSDEAERLYLSLCEGQSELAEDFLLESPSIDLFYDELYSIHPEIDDVPKDRLDDHQLCPWSCAHDKSSRHIIMACVWPQAPHVYDLVSALAEKHGLNVYNPQAEASPEAPKSKFRKLAASWDSLQWWQRLLIGLLVVSVFSFAIFVVVYFSLVPSP